MPVVSTIEMRSLVLSCFLLLSSSQLSAQDKEVNPDEESTPQQSEQVEIATKEEASTPSEDVRIDEPTIAAGPKVIVVSLDTPSTPVAELAKSVSQSTKISSPLTQQERDAGIGNNQQGAMFRFREKLRKADSKEELLVQMGSLWDANLIVLVDKGRVSLFYPGASSFFEKEWAVTDAVALQRKRIETHALWTTKQTPSKASNTKATTKVGSWKSKASNKMVASDKEITGQKKEDKSFLAKTWPYFVVGALLVAAVVFIAVDASSGNKKSGPPLFRFDFE